MIMIGVEVQRLRFWTTDCESESQGQQAAAAGSLSKILNCLSDLYKYVTLDKAICQMFLKSSDTYL